jgi:surface-anchored protein
MITMTRSMLILMVAVNVAWSQSPPYRLDGVHVDVNISYSAGNWVAGAALAPVPQFGNQSFIPASQAQLVVNTNAATIVNQPSSPNFAFIGAGAGQPLYRLSQNNLAPNQLFLGVESSGMLNSAPGLGWANWNPHTVPINPTGNPGAPNVTGRLIEYIITDVRAPQGGHLSMWFGSSPTVYASTFLRGNESPTNANSYFALIDGHTHYNWGFTKDGIYEVDIIARTFYTNNAGQLTELRSNPQSPFTFTFRVGNILETIQESYAVYEVPTPVNDGLSSFPYFPRPAPPVPEPAVGIAAISLVIAVWARGGRGQSRRLSDSQGF